MSVLNQQGLLCAVFLFQTLRRVCFGVIVLHVIKCIKTMININKRQDASTRSSTHMEEDHFVFRSEAPPWDLDLVAFLFS